MGLLDVSWGWPLPALLSMEFAQHSRCMAVMSPIRNLDRGDGMLHAPGLGFLGSVLSMVCLIVGLLVFLPSQMSIVDDIARRWTDIYLVVQPDNSANGLPTGLDHLLRNPGDVCSVVIHQGTTDLPDVRRRPGTDGDIDREREQSGLGRDGVSCAVDQSPLSSSGVTAPLVQPGRALPAAGCSIWGWRRLCSSPRSGH